MAMSHVSDHESFLIPGGFVGDQRFLKVPAFIGMLQGAFYTSLSWLVLGGLFLISSITFGIGIALAGRLPQLFSIPHSRIASSSRRYAFTRRQA